jgi:hypothetical protein
MNRLLRAVLVTAGQPLVAPSDFTLATAPPAYVAPGPPFSSLASGTAVAVAEHATCFLLLPWLALLASKGAELLAVARHSSVCCCGHRADGATVKGGGRSNLFGGFKGCAA